MQMLPPAANAAAHPDKHHAAEAGMAASFSEVTRTQWAPQAYCTRWAAQRLTRVVAPGSLLGLLLAGNAAQPESRHICHAQQRGGGCAPVG